MLRRWCIPLAGLALVAGAFAAAGPAAAASPRHSAPAAPHAVHVNPGGPLGLAAGSHSGLRHETSNNWSGYDVTSGGYTSVSASWVEPTGHCSSGSTQYSSFWVGLDGDGSSTVEQLGSEVDCSGGSPVYYAWWEMYPGPSHNFSAHAVHPGDHFSASVTNTSGTSYTLEITDSTQGWSKTQHKSLASASDASAEAIVEAPCCTASGGILPLADFGTINFSNVMVDGASIGSQSPNEITMVDSSGKDKDTVSSLSGNTAFSATWDRSN